MFELLIPGRDKLHIENVVFDYNGTLAVDGRLAPQIEAQLQSLTEKLNVYILTADTYGTVSDQCRGLNVKIKTFPREEAGKAKREIVRELGGYKTIAVGNGNNDIAMFKESVLTMAVILNEGCFGKLIIEADIVYNDIEDVFAALHSKQRIKATLRH